MANTRQTSDGQPFNIEVRDDNVPSGANVPAGAPLAPSSVRRVKKTAPICQIPNISSITATGDNIAYLIPDSEPAIRALASLQPDQTYHAKYIARLLHPPGDLPLSSQPLVWAYKFAPDHLTTSSWKIGCGVLRRGQRDPSRGVEFRLCAVGNRKARQHIDSLQGDFFIDKRSGAWMFKNTSEKHAVTYLNGCGSKDIMSWPPLTLGKDDSTVLWMRQNRLRIGPYHYLFQFTGPLNQWDAIRHQEHDSWYLEARDRKLPAISANPVSRYLHPLPRDMHTRTQHYILHESTITANLGRSTRIHAGVDAKTGDPVAIKQIYTSFMGPTGRHLDYVSHIANVGMFENNLTGILPLFHHWCEHTPAPCSSKPIESRSLAMPLALGDFGTFDFSNVSWTTRLQLYRQTLQGLATIHADGYMHKAIKPGHLLVLSATPDSPSAAICDLSMCSNIPTPNNIEAVLIHAAPPEAVGVTDEEWGQLVPPHPYTRAVDVWGLAYSWLWALAPLGSGVPNWEKQPNLDKIMFMMRGHSWYNGLVDRKRHATILDFVDQAVDQVLAGSEGGGGDAGREMKVLLKAMLAWDPTERISAEDALASPVWADAVAAAATTAAEQLSEPQEDDVPPAPQLKAKRPRVRAGEGGGPAKRVRRGKGAAALVPVRGEGAVVAEGAAAVSGDVVASVEEVMVLSMEAGDGGGAVV